MQQVFHTRNYSVRDFEEWHQRGELVLQPKFQRRDVWSDKARSYLIDTIVRGKSIPKLYMRQDTKPKMTSVALKVGLAKGAVKECVLREFGALDLEGGEIQNALENPEGIGLLKYPGR